jgi:hypothetical protein
LTGEAIYAFVSFKENIEINENKTITELKQLIKEKIAAYAIPDVFLVLTEFSLLTTISETFEVFICLYTGFTTSAENKVWQNNA